MSDRGPWIQTYTGKAFYPQDPQPGDINIVDIAHSLSMTCRFGGHTTRFYSVAQHSALVAANVPAADALWGLLHDASEAYLADVSKPVKPLLTGYSEIEGKVMAAVCQKFGLPPEMPASVKAMDATLLFTEKRDVMAASLQDWGYAVPPLPGTINPFAPREAELMFRCSFSQHYKGT